MQTHAKSNDLEDTNMEAEKFDYEIAIIGGGSAGFAAAKTASSYGMRSILIEGAPQIGGLCILGGCMPTKMLLHSAEVFHNSSHNRSAGIVSERVSLEFNEVMAHKNRFINDLATERKKEITEGKFKFMQGTARFIDANRIVVNDTVIVAAASFVIATGSHVLVPHLAGLREVGFLTSDDALELKELPESMVILGGGPVAVEFAQMFARFGVRVSLLQRGEHILSECDFDSAQALERVLRREGIDIFTKVELLSVSQENDMKIVRFVHDGGHVSVSANTILVALGRGSNTRSLNLVNAEVVTEQGRIVADEWMQTSATHIYAAGDCTGPHDVVHLAVQQGQNAAHNICNPHDRQKLAEGLSLAVIFTEPQVATVGLTEKHAKAHGIRFLAAKYLFSDHGKSIIMNATDGHVKILADPDSGLILGAACVGPYGGELIHEIVVAIAKQMTVHELMALPHYHPTLAEIWTYPAEMLAHQVRAQVS